MEDMMMVLWVCEAYGGYDDGACEYVRPMEDMMMVHVSMWGLMEDMMMVLWVCEAYGGYDDVHVRPNGGYDDGACDGFYVTWSGGRCGYKDENM